MCKQNKVRTPKVRVGLYDNKKVLDLIRKDK